MPTLLDKARSNRHSALRWLRRRPFGGHRRPVLTLLRAPDDIAEPLFVKAATLAVAA